MEVINTLCISGNRSHSVWHYICELESELQQETKHCMDWCQAGSKATNEEALAVTWLRLCQPKLKECKGDREERKEVSRHS